jgi:hypothetical protein
MLLPACTGGSSSDVPTPLHPGTAPTSTTATPTAIPTEVAAAAAIAAVQRMYAEYNTMLQTLSSEKFRKTFAKSCAFCVGDADTIDDISRRSETIDGGVMRLLRYRVDYATDRVAIVEGDVKDSPATVLKGSQIVKRFAGGTTTQLTWRVEKQVTGWIITQENLVR